MLPRSAIHRTLWLQTRPLFPPNFRPLRAFGPSRSSAVRPMFRLISTEISETERTDNGDGGGVASTWSSSESPSSADRNIVTKEEIRRQTPESGPNQSGSLQPEPLRVHQFDTYKIVLALQNAGFSQPQAVALMKCLRTVLVNGTEFAKSHYLTRGDLENETYLFRAAMSELRTEVKTLRHNEAVGERADIIIVQKELDALNQRTREDLENLRNEVTIEMNNRKIATRTEHQTMQIKIQDLNNNFTKRLADMRTEAEAQKWQTTRLLIVTLVVMIICGLGVTRYLRMKQDKILKASEGVQTDAERPSSASDMVSLG